MAKGGHRRPTKRRKNFKRNNNDETRNLIRARDRKKQLRRSRSLTRQMRGMKWDEEEYSEDYEEELEDQ